MSFYKEVPGRKTTLESTLKFDTAPTSGSTNPVTSGGVSTAITEAVGGASEVLQEQIDEIAEKAGSGYITKGEADVATLNGLTGQENGWLYTMTDAGTLTDGSLAVTAGDTVAWDEANSVWYKAMDYAPSQYGTNEVRNLPTAITAFRTGDVIPVDGPSGTAKMSKDDLLRVTAETLGTKALSKIRTETTLPTVTEVEGKAILTSGSIVDNPTSNYSEFSVSGLDAVSIYSYGTNVLASILFRDASNNIVGNPISASSSGYNFFIANVPYGATKVQMCYSVYGSRTHDIKAWKFTEDVEVIEDINNRITEPYVDYKYTTIYPTEAGAYLFSDGSLSTVGGDLWKHTDKIPIDAGLKVIRITNRITASILYTKFFNSLDQEITPRVGGVANSNGVAEFRVPEGAASVIISVIDYSSNYQNYCVEFGYEKINKVNDNNGLNDCKFRDLADVTMIPIFGQSLSIGSASTPALSRTPKYKAGIQFNEGLICQQKTVAYFTEFMPLFERDLGQTEDSEGTGETIASGCCDKLLELIQNEDGVGVHSELWNGKKILFVCVGAGSKTIADLTNDYLQGFLNAVQGAKNICDANDKSLNVPCWIWIQGETDQKQHTTTGDYQTSLLSLQASIVSGVKSITRQTNDPQCITSQCGAQNIVLPSDMSPTYTTEAVDVPTAQMQVVRDNNAFSFACPSYILDHSSAEYIHLSNFGSRMMGLYFGKAVKAILDGKKFGGILPKTYSVSGNDLVIKCDVPCKPLEIDTEWVKEVSNYGFSIVNSSNVNLLTSVEVFGDEITLHCSASPVGCIVYYGVDGTAYRDGRVQGARGNVRDSAGYIFSGSVGNERICLHNWLPMFKSAIASSSGNID